MISFKTEKKEEGSFILKDEKVSVKTTFSAPFETTEDIFLKGNLFDLAKNEVTFKKAEAVSPDKRNLLWAEDPIKAICRDLDRYPENPIVLNNLGLAYLNRNELDKAIDCFKKSVLLKPDFVLCKLNLACAYTKKNEYKSAVAIYKDILDRDPKDIRALINMGNLELKDKKFNNAKDIFKKVLLTDSKNISAFNHLAMIDFIEGKYNDAIARLRKAIEINPTSPALHNNIGIAYAASKSYEKAMDSFKVALRLFPNYKSAIANLATVLREIGNLPESIDVLENYLKENESFAIRELLSSIYSRNKQYQKALTNLTQVFVEQSKRNAPKIEIARLHNNIGVIYHQMRDYQKAKENYFSCVEKAGYINFIIVGNIIDLYFDLNKLEDAKKYIEILCDKFPKESICLYYMATYNYHSGHIDKARKLTEDFLDKNKMFIPAYMLLGFIYSEYKQDYQKGIETYKAGLTINPNNVMLMNNLAYNYLMVDNLENARKVLEKVKDINDNICLFATRGLLKMKEGKIEDGSALYNYASKVALNKQLKEDVLTKKNLELAKYYMKINNGYMAKEYLEKAMAINSNSIYLMQVSKLLNSFEK